MKSHAFLNPDYVTTYKRDGHR